MNNTLKSILIGVISITVSILVGCIVGLITGISPMNILTGLYSGTIGSISNFGEWIMYSLPLMMTGLSVAFAYRAGLFNIGAEGQFLVGSFVAVYVGINMDLPPIIFPIVCILAAALAAGLYAGLAGFLKAKYGVSEVVVTIMLNYIALKYINYLIQFSAGDIITKTVSMNENASLKNEALITLFNGARMHNGFIVVIIALVIYWFIMEKTTYGYEIRAVGYNPFASKASGININTNIFTTMMISGMFSGIAGAIYSLATVDGIAVQASFPNIGFDGIGVALLGQLTSGGIAIAGLLIGAFRVAAPKMESVPPEISSIIIGITILFSAIGYVFKDKIFVGGKKWLLSLVCYSLLRRLFVQHWVDCFRRKVEL
ncbi:MAG: ABC transporter permease [Mycoplasmatales bacterium]